MRDTTAYSGAYLLLRERNKWWLFRGRDHDLKVRIDANSDKQTASADQEPWQPFALGGLTESDPWRLINKTLLEAPFMPTRYTVIGSLPIRHPLLSNPSPYAVIYVEVAAQQLGDTLSDATRDYQLVTADEVHKLLPNSPLLSFVEEIEQSGPSRNLLTPPETLDPNERVTKKVFYIPRIFDHTSLPGSYPELGLPTTGQQVGMTFASRVLPGQTLLDAVAADLHNSFHYQGRHTVLEVIYRDTHKDNQGKSCKRYIVSIMLNEAYDPTNHTINGHRLGWLKENQL